MFDTNKRREICFENPQVLPVNQVTFRKTVGYRGVDLRP
jgi:hypothetical protein